MKNLVLFGSLGFWQWNLEAHGGGTYPRAPLPIKKQVRVEGLAIVNSWPRCGIPLSLFASKKYKVCSTQIDFRQQSFAGLLGIKIKDE